MIFQRANESTGVSVIIYMNRHRVIQCHGLTIFITLSLSLSLSIALPFACVIVRAEAGGKKLRSTIQRSTETGLAVEMRSRMTRQASRESTDGSMNSYSSEGK